MKNINGFTLIEILVVVLIIGVLAAIAVPQYQLAAGKSKFAAVKGIAKAIADAEERYYNNNGEYTKDFSALDVTKPSDVSCWIWATGINSQKAVACYASVNNITMAYYHFFNKGNPYNNDGKRACLVFSTNKNDVPNRICQNDTGKKLGDNNDGYITYYYNK